MIRNKEDLKKQVKEKLDKRADELIDSMDCNEEDFTIDTIEDIMTRFNADSKQIVVETINESIASFDEKKIINKKN
jgi:predicted house-cleaning noncanonical NTP pyrophosphatase (MazG superfamily)